MKKSTIITDMQAEIAALKEVADKKANKKDEAVCPDCGNDLEYIEEGTVFCPKCQQYFDVEEEEE